LELQIGAIVSIGFAGALPSEVFADGDEFHFGRDHSLPRIMQLRDGAAMGRLARSPAHAGKQFEMMPALALLGVFETQKAVVLGTHPPAFIFDAIATIEHPSFAHWRQSHANITFNFGIAPRAARVIDPE